MALRGGQRLGDRVDELRVVGDVLADPAVAAGRERPHPAALVDDVHREAVDLELAEHRRHRAEVALDARGPRVELLEGERVVEAEHPLQVLDRREHSGGLAADRLGRRVLADQLGVRRLERLELAEEGVVLGVGQGRGVVDVVARARRLDLLDQLAPARGDVGPGILLDRLGGRGLTSRHGGPPGRAARGRRRAGRAARRARGRGRSGRGRRWATRAPGGRSRRGRGRGAVRGGARPRR